MIDRIRSMREQGVSSVVLAPSTRLPPLKTALLLWLGLCGFTAGCGQKGPLTLPPSKAAPAASSSAASVPAK